MNKLIYTGLAILAGLLNPVSTFAQENCSKIDPYPAEISNINPWDDSRFGQAKFKARDNNSLNVYYYLPSQWNANSPIVFVMHGAARNALEYLETFAPVAEQYNTIALAPEFPERYYSQSEDYSLGVGISSVPYTGSYNANEWKASDDYLYSEIEHLFETTKQLLALNTCGYFIVGHSAGGQFIHRMVSFIPDARIIRAVAANSGWYTLPSKGPGNDINYYMPYGLQGSPIDLPRVRESFLQELIVLVGENDTRTPSQDSSVRGTEEAMFQGDNRNERGNFYFQTARQEASDQNTTFNWQLDEVPEAGHDFDQIVQSAAWYLAYGGNACTSTTAANATQLVINEIHADPAFGSDGDANNDGNRDSQDDEFIEIINNGSQSICLSGWTLGDSSETNRHVFPLGTNLLAGQAIVIFGGGIPTGDFGGSLVQWAAYSGSLSLSNNGDGIRLYDKQGTLAQQLSWGDCGDMNCANEHISQNLEIDQSIVRWPEISGSWQSHTTTSNKLFSPGTQANGNIW